VRAEAPAVQQWVEAHAHQLRDSLDGVGLRLDDLVVTAEDRRQRGSHEREDQRPARRRPQPREIAVRFEVLA
jgi:flagellar hook-length control protein FliK